MAKQTIFCKKCGKMHEIEDEKPTVFGTLLKWGGYGVVAVLAINFLAISNYYFCCINFCDGWIN